MDKVNLIDFSKYTISKEGTIFSNKYNRYMLGTPDKKRGYLTIYMCCKDGKPRNFYFHRIIWIYFNGEIPKGLELNHKDENKFNNSLDNLELLNHTDNINYGTRTKRAAKTNSFVQKGKTLSDEHIEKLRKASAKRRTPIIQYDLKTNKPIRKWDCLKDIQRELNFEPTHISQCCKGIYSQAYSYGWKYA